MRPILAACLALLLTAPAWAQEFPTRPIRFIVPFAPGGSNDVTARLMAPIMSARLGQPVVIETRPGAGGMTGVDVAAKAAPDGYTVVLGTTGGIITGPAMMASPPFDPLRDLAAITRAINVQVPIAVPGNSPYRTLGEFFAAARAAPGTLTYASSGTGGLPHLLGELIRLAAGIEIIHVPYRGGAPAGVAVLRGETHAGLSDLPVFAPNVATGAVRFLAVGQPSRMPRYPDVPTLAELGIPGIDTNNWHGLVTAAGVPAPILDRLNAAAVAALHDPDVVRAIENQDMQAVGDTRAAFAAFLVAEAARWRGAIRQAGIRPE